MPKDDWEKARRNDIARKAKRAARQQAQQQFLVAHRKDPVALASSLNRRSRLWFGKHKGSRICQTPNEYLLWVANNLGKNPKSPRLQALVIYLKQYLTARPAAPQTIAPKRHQGQNAALDDRALTAIP